MSAPWNTAATPMTMARSFVDRRSCVRKDSNATLRLPRAGGGRALLPVVGRVDVRLPLRDVPEERERALPPQEPQVRHGVRVARAQRERLLQVLDALVRQLDPQGARDVAGHRG